MILKKLGIFLMNMIAYGLKMNNILNPKDLCILKI